MSYPDPTETEYLRRLYARRVAEQPLGGDRDGCVSPEAILALVRREAGERERLAALEHVMACAACHREYRWLRAVDEAALEAGRVGGRRAWWPSVPVALAASLAAAVTAGVLARHVIPRGPEPLRGTEGGITLVAPPPVVPAGAPITFTWRSLPGATLYVLEVQRGGMVAFADTTGDTTVTLNDPAAVLAGSGYEWWVRELSGGPVPRSSAIRRLTLEPR